MHATKAPYLPAALAPLVPPACPRPRPLACPLTTRGCGVRARLAGGTRSRAHAGADSLVRWHGCRKLSRPSGNIRRHEQSTGLIQSRYHLSSKSSVLRFLAVVSYKSWSMRLPVIRQLPAIKLHATGETEWRGIAIFIRGLGGQVPSSWQA